MADLEKITLADGTELDIRDTRVADLQTTVRNNTQYLANYNDWDMTPVLADNHLVQLIGTGTPSSNNLTPSKYIGQRYLDMKAGIVYGATPTQWTVEYSLKRVVDECASKESLDSIKQDLYEQKERGYLQNDNILGLDKGSLYKVDLKQGEKVTIAVKNPSEIQVGSIVKVNFYDANKTVNDYWTLTQSTQTGGCRTVTLAKDATYASIDTTSTLEFGLFKGTVTHDSYVDYVLPNTKIADLSKDLDEQGLSNKYDGQLRQGVYSASGVWQNNVQNWVTIANPIYCSNKKFIRTVADVNTIRATFFNGDTFVSYKDTTDGKFDVPANVTKVYIGLYASGLTVANAHSISIYVDSEFDKTNSNLDSLEFNGWTIPDGMPLKDTTLVERVDLGSLTWTYLNEKFYAVIGSHKQYSVSAIPEIYCDKYTTKSSNDVVAKNKGITLGNATHWGIDTVGVYDNAYTDVNSFKNSVKGVYLYYPLATPKALAKGNETVTKINQSLDDYGLVNKYANNLKQGGYGSDGVYYPSYSGSEKDVCTTDKQPCNGKNVTLKIQTNNIRNMYVNYYNSSGTFISQVLVSGITENTFVAPSGATQYTYGFGFNSATTPSQVGHVGVYVNNEIDTIKESLVAIKHFTKAHNYTAANFDVEFDVSVAGYTPIGIATFSIGARQAGITVTSTAIADGKAHIYGVSTVSASLYPTIDVLYAKGYTKLS